MPIALAHIYRYPVKGLAPEVIDTVLLQPDQGLPLDRRFGIARGDSKLDPAAPRWRPKEWFVMLMRDTALARVGCRLIPERNSIELQAPGKPPCVARFDTADGRRIIEAYVNDLLGQRREGPARWIEASDVSFTDVPHNCLSLINLESVRELEARMDAALNPLRFRANLYIDGAPPWAEFDWVGREIEIGEARLRVATRIPRCAATAVNPETGERDVNIVKGLRAAYGHYDMGVYAEVVQGGTLRVGDSLTPPSDPRSRSRLGNWLRFVRFLARAAPTVLRQR
ncbi:MAG TPA: MOSC domain-containing protein [Candidatus Acidoferrales bacterium]|nr:MOSC domain-containing protein [Candidatus Acidoferrales bacterium]